jgi:chorismate-pyruvate lyase
MPEFTLEALSEALPRPLAVPTYRYLEGWQVPEPYQHLLVHDRHMTLAMEEYHHCKIAVSVLQSNGKALRQVRHRAQMWYVRQIVLHPVGEKKIVQGGIVRIHLSMLEPAVQEAILREDTPLGHILVEHEVLRHISVKKYLELQPGPALSAAWPSFPMDQVAYARLGILYCDLQPAIEVFEVVPGSLSTDGK